MRQESKSWWAINFSFGQHFSTSIYFQKITVAALPKE